ncbi:hypothetical protein QLL95_gp0329 [Cotonvirus japonicus]|uniref:Uncharacterized protein n=1 Tax=Cotonvirus japonicus TaxID=2811091 RepID=A0ABM7NUD2_9VIRU|nr:hypothetical protein QLL95_gp0329 [Cotonvirus japonicus]BCS83794.1 hypothetical protein [Cotonvirus japonicus]
MFHKRTMKDKEIEMQDKEIEMQKLKYENHDKEMEFLEKQIELQRMKNETNRSPSFSQKGNRSPKKNIIEL